MQFLSPIWFTALAALIIPVVIHLWNITPGKTLKVGSISLITEASKTTRRSFKLLDVLLLLLRCLLLAMLALFLAVPLWQNYTAQQKVTGWLLIPQENLKESYQKFKPKIDSLTAAGYEFHYFNKGFAKANLKEVLTDTAVNATITANYWSLVKQLDTRVPPELPMEVFTPNGVGHFAGVKPSSNLNIQWHTYTPADSVSKWVAAAAFTNTNAIKVTQGNSSPAGTYFTEQVVQGDGDKNMAVSVQNGQPQVSLNGAKTAVQVDTSTLHIAIYTDKYPADAAYLKAALSAVANFTGRKALIRQYTKPEQIPAGQTWLFWLSEQGLSERLKSSNIFTYVNGKINAVNSCINTDNAQISLFKSIVTTDKNRFLLADGFGNAVLSLEQKQNVNIYRFYTHFNPLWNDMVWSDSFPAILLQLIGDKANNQSEKYDRRILTNTQILPNKIIADTARTTVSAAEPTDVSKYFWLMLVALFIAERLLAHKKKQGSNG